MTRPLVAESIDVTDQQLADLMDSSNVEPRHPGWRRAWSRETRARVAFYCQQDQASASYVPVRPVVLRARRRRR